MEIIEQNTLDGTVKMTEDINRIYPILKMERKQAEKKKTEIQRSVKQDNNEELTFI